MKKISIVATLLLGATLPFLAQAETLDIPLTGNLEVPAVTTPTTGRLMLTVDETGAPFDLMIMNGSGITSAHLHCAKPGENGPIIAHLWGDIPGGFNITSSSIAHFTLTDGNLLPAGSSCPTPVQTITDLRTAISRGNIYANVHSLSNPNGLIRANLLWPDQMATSTIGTGTVSTFSGAGINATSTAVGASGLGAATSTGTTVTNNTTTTNGTTSINGFQNTSPSSLFMNATGTPTNGTSTLGLGEGIAAGTGTTGTSSPSFPNTGIPGNFMSNDNQMAMRNSLINLLTQLRDATQELLNLIRQSQ